MLAPVEHALEEQYGTPDDVPDHGPQYTGADAARLLGSWRVLPTFAPVGSLKQGRSRG